MTLKVRFALSLIVILVLSWADVFFVGSHKNMFIPGMLHQPLHILALLSTMLIGYFNWKEYPEKWLAGLWLAAYVTVLSIIALGAMVYFLKIDTSASFSQTIIYVRNTFTWPMPFLITYMLHLMVQAHRRG